MKAPFIEKSSSVNNKSKKSLGPCNVFGSTVILEIRVKETVGLFFVGACLVHCLMD